ncbi:MAG: PKD domain-containing protein [Methanobacteriota archaeon]
MRVSGSINVFSIKTLNSSGGLWRSTSCYRFLSFILGFIILSSMVSTPLCCGVEPGGSEPLIACFSWNPVEPVAGSPVFFDASCCYCPEGEFPPMLNRQVESLQGALVEGVAPVDQSGVLVKGVAPLGGGELIDQHMILSGEPEGFASGESCMSGESTYIESYFWVFGDGNYSDEMNPVHVFAEPGNYSVSLTVVANTGESDSRSILLEVRSVHGRNMFPVAQSGGPYFGWVDEPVFFDGSNSTDPDGCIVSYQWFFGDGCVAFGEQVVHVYEHSGLYTVGLSVTDDEGGVNTSITVARVVRDPPAACAGESYFGCVHRLILFDGSGSSDVDGVIIGYEWDFGDGSNGSGVLVSHTYAYPGTYEVSLTVVDDDGEFDSDTTFAVIVEQCGPSMPEVSGPIMVLMDAEGVYRAVSVDPENDTVCYVVDWGDGSTLTSPFFPSGTVLSAVHAWGSVGTYCVRVSAVDEYSSCSEVAEYVVVVVESDGSVFSGDVSGRGSFGQDPGVLSRLFGGGGESWIVSFLVLVGLLGLVVVMVCFRKK